MGEAEREVIEGQLRALCERAAFADAAGALIRGYGPEIFRFIASIARDAVATEDAFSAFSEQVLTGLPTFQRKSSFRTWGYAIARNAALQQRRGTRRRERREVTDDGEGSVLAIADAVRTETAAYLRTEVKSRFAKLREELSEDDRTLLVLRVDRDLEWLDIAQVLEDAPTDQETDPSELKRRAAKLRKRFQTVKERLVELGKREGLLGDERAG